MGSASSAFSTGVPALAAIPQLAGNSRQGFRPVASTMHWASGWAISSNTLGMKGSLYDGDAGPRSTGKERDTEFGNDYFDARSYSSAMGRFMSPDWSANAEPVPYAKLGDPRTRDA
jgi:RHS repeat-associated protein